MIAILCMTLPFVAAGAAETAQTFPAAGVRALDIQTEEGYIKVVGNDVQQIKVIIVNQNPEKCEMMTALDGSTLRLKAKSKSKLFWRSDCEAGFQVQSPKNISLDASSGSGRIRATGLHGALALNTGSGEIQVDDVTGDMNARLGSGTLKGDSRSQQMEIQCGSGSVDLDGLLGSANVRVGSGAINLKWAESPKNGKVNIKTGSGNVSLIFPKQTKLQTDILTGSGRVRNEIGETASAPLRISVIAGSGNVTIGKQTKQLQP